MKMEKEYIDREALIRYTEKQEVIIKDGTSIADAMRIQGNVFRRCVETCPAADVAPVVHGEWKFEWDAEKDPKKYFIRIVCSRCGLKTGEKSNYCPKCGAKMDEERKEQE
jgi:hypothetical protein